MSVPGKGGAAWLAEWSLHYFLLALFVLASGVVIVQVVANPLISLLGPQKTAHSRLTFAQAFNSFGTWVFPLVGAAIILGSLAEMSADQLSGAELVAYRQAESEAIWQGYLGVAALIAIVLHWSTSFKPCCAAKTSMLSAWTRRPRAIHNSPKRVSSS